MDASRTTRAWVENFGFPSGKELETKLLEFPMGPERLREAIEESGLTDPDYDDPYVGEIESCPVPGLARRLADAVTVENLDLLSMQMACMSEHELEAAGAYIASVDEHLNAYDTLGILLQADSVPYYGYGESASADDGPEAAYGRHLLDAATFDLLTQAGFDEEHLANSDLGQVLRMYVDVEALGRDTAINEGVTLFESGYVLDDSRSGFERNPYSPEQAIELAAGNAAKLAAKTNDTRLATAAREWHEKALEAAVAQVEKKLVEDIPYYNLPKGLAVRYAGGRYTQDVKTGELSEMTLQKLFVQEVPFETALERSSMELTAFDLNAVDESTRIVERGEPEFDMVLKGIADERGGWVEDEPSIVNAICEAERWRKIEQFFRDDDIELPDLKSDREMTKGRANPKNDIGHGKAKGK